MLKLIILVVVGYVFYRALKSWMLGSGSQSADLDGKGKTEVDDVLVQDPVCKTYITQRDSIHLQQDGKVLYFCSEQCRDRYIASSS